MPATFLGQAALQVLKHELDSFEKLEIVHAVASADPGARVDLPTLAARTRVGTHDVRRAIETLTAQRVLAHDGARLVLGERARAEDLEELMAAYARDQARVLSTLSSLAVERIRNWAASALGPRLRKLHED